jgi:uncharacterized protein
VQAQLQWAAFERGYGQPGLPQPYGHVCIADSEEGMVITPEGLVFKCWNEVTNPAKAVHNLSLGRQTLSMKRNAERWMNWDPFTFPNCLDCHVLPICLGGCPYLGLERQDQRPHGYCRELKHNLPEMLAIHYLAFKKRQAISQLTTKLHEWTPELVPDLHSE